MAQVLRHLPPQFADPNVLVGLDVADDAAVYRLTDDLALVFTVDFFTPVVDDPYAFGAIAVANSVSDVYAMGGRPVAGLNILCYPQDPGDLPPDVLPSILKGGYDKAAEAGFAIVGGHTVDDKEPKYGLAVTGLAHPDKITTKAAARPGDQLVLTKPLGIGVITTAIKAGVAEAKTEAEAIRVMSALNRDAAEVMLAHSLRAATDITGYGLVGHLGEVCRASGVEATVFASRVPVIEGALGLAEMGVIPAGTMRNLDYFSDFVAWDPAVSMDVQTLLADAQTSGGLLMAVPPEKLDSVLSALAAIGTPAVAHIGEVTVGIAGRIRVMP